MKNCGDSLLEERDLFQGLGEGATPISPLQFRVKECKFYNIRPIFEKYHYKKAHIGGGISFCLALTYKDNIVGGAVMGLPRHGSKYKDCIEIRRMALLDECPKYSESYFLGKIIWWIKKHNLCKNILSYADESVGHKGIIYKATNFKLVGKTNPSVHIFWNGVRYHPRSLTINRPYSYKLREALKTGEAKKEVGLPKNIYLYIIKEK
jgi:hypothetical protein